MHGSTAAGPVLDATGGTCITCEAEIPAIQPSGEAVSGEGELTDAILGMAESEASVEHASPTSQPHVVLAQNETGFVEEATPAGNLYPDAGMLTFPVIMRSLPYVAVAMALCAVLCIHRWAMFNAAAQDRNLSRRRTHSYAC